MPYSPYIYNRRQSREVVNIGNAHVPVVIADYMKEPLLSPGQLTRIGYHYSASLDKWNIADAAADYIYCAKQLPSFKLPGTLRVICDANTWVNGGRQSDVFPLFQAAEYLQHNDRSGTLNFISVDANSNAATELLQEIRRDQSVVLCVWSSHPHTMPSVRRFLVELMNQQVNCPVIITVASFHDKIDDQLIQFSTEAGALFLDGMGDGIWLMNDPSKIINARVTGRTYLEAKDNHQFLNNTSFSILQATRTRISKTEYISCPSCGRTLFDLQETTARIRAVTHHLKGVKIAIMGCIVNGPGEMADADFGYVGSGPGKITLYKGKDIVKKNIDSSIAVEELINLLRESDVWISPEASLVNS